VITEVTGRRVTYTDLPVDVYASRLEQAGLDETSSQFVARLDASIANGDLETNSQDLERLLGHPATPLVDPVRAARGRRGGGGLAESGWMAEPAQANEEVA
jgi:NAD(P)H dehydrogenase (quinone)